MGIKLSIKWNSRHQENQGVLLHVNIQRCQQHFDYRRPHSFLPWPDTPTDIHGSLLSPGLWLLRVPDSNLLQSQPQHVHQLRWWPTLLGLLQQVLVQCHVGCFGQDNDLPVGHSEKKIASSGIRTGEIGDGRNAEIRWHARLLCQNLQGRKLQRFFQGPSAWKSEGCSVYPPVLSNVRNLQAADCNHAYATRPEEENST